MPVGLADHALVERPALGHGELQVDQVDAVHQLGDRVLDLEAGVHLQEEEPVAVRVVEELDGAGSAVVDRRGGLARRLVQRTPGLLGQVRARRLLDDLLVAALDRAVALAEDEDAVAVTEHLHLDVAAVLDVRLDEDGAVAEGRRASASAVAISAGRSARVRTTRMPRPPPPADALTSRGRSFSVADSAVWLVSTGTPAFSISFLDSILEPICSIDSGAGPTQVRPAAMTERANSAFSERKP